MASLNNNHDIKVSSRKRDEPEKESEHESKNEESNPKKKAKVSVTSVLEPLASFDTLDDDCLGNVLEFVGKKSYSAFGRVNKRCHEMFCSKGFPKVTFLYGYGPLHLIQQQGTRKGWYQEGCRYGVLYYNRMDVLEWMMRDDPDNYLGELKWMCCEAIDEARLGILRLVFQRANEEQLEYLRNYDNDINLCSEAACYEQLECLKFLTENKCKYDEYTWMEAEHDEDMLQYMRDNEYLTTK